MSSNTVLRRRGSGLLVAVAIALSLNACNKKQTEIPEMPQANKPESPYGPTQTPSATVSQMSTDEQRPPAAAGVASPDINTALSEYRSLDSGVQLAYLYYALSGLPTDYEKLATIGSLEYRTTTDSFKKADILAVLKPQIAEQIEFFRKHRYVKIKLSNVAIGHYQIQTMTFPLRSLSLSEDNIVVFNDSPAYRMAIVNGSAFDKLKMEDQNQARAVESLVTKGLPNYYIGGQYPTPTMAYLFAQDIDQNSGIVKFGSLDSTFLTKMVDHWEWSVSEGRSASKRIFTPAT